MKCIETPWMDIPDPVNTLKQDLELCGIEPNRLKGQNYLISSRVRDRIADTAGISPGEPVLEIGSGTGILTWALAVRNADILAVEKELSAARLLTKRFASCTNVAVLNGDGLDVMRRTLSPEDDVSRRIVSNLPFAISSPVLQLMAENPSRWPGGIILLQKEVVDRVIAGPGDSDRSALSVLVQLRFAATRAFNVKSTFFRPVPSVDSAVLILKPLRCDYTVPWAFLVKTVFDAFSHRRKTLLNNLKSVSDADTAATLLAKTGIPGNIRPQQLPIQAFVDLAEARIRTEKVI